MQLPPSTQRLPIRYSQVPLISSLCSLQYDTNLFLFFSPPFLNPEQVVATQQASPSTAIPDYPGTGVTVSVTVGDDFPVETVVITVSINHPASGMHSFYSNSNFFLFLYHFSLLSF
jgi:hypothetical protein